MNTTDLAAHVDRITASRRSTIRHRAFANPAGLTQYEFTQGFTKDNALQFWNDAKALGLVVVGTSPRGAKLLAFPEGMCPACETRRNVYHAGPCNVHNDDVWVGAL